MSEILVVTVISISSRLLQTVNAPAITTHIHLLQVASKVAKPSTTKAKRRSPNRSSSTYACASVLFHTLAITTRYKTASWVTSSPQKVIPVRILDLPRHQTTHPSPLLTTLPRRHRHSQTQHLHPQKVSLHMSSMSRSFLSHSSTSRPPICQRDS